MVRKIREDIRKEAPVKGLGKESLLCRKEAGEGRDIFTSADNGLTGCLTAKNCITIKTCK